MWIASGDTLVSTGKPSEAAPAYQTASEVAETLVEVRPGNREYQHIFGVSRIRFGYVATVQRRHGEALAIWNDLIARFSDTPDFPARQLVANALFNKGVTLDRLRRREEALVVYDNVVTSFGNAPELPLRERAADALLNKEVTLCWLRRRKKALAVYDDLVARFGHAPEPTLRERVAKALVNKGVWLGQLRRREEAIATYDDIVARFGDAPEAALREQVADALFEKAILCGPLGLCEEDRALAVFDDLITRFRDAPELSLRERAAKAFLYKGVSLVRLDRRDEGLAVYDGLVARFGTAPELSLRECVGDALGGKAVALRFDRYEEMLAVHDEIVARFGDAREPSLLEQVLNALMGSAATLSRHGRGEEASAVYDEVIARFGHYLQPPFPNRVAAAIRRKKEVLAKLDSVDEKIVGDPRNPEDPEVGGGKVAAKNLIGSRGAELDAGPENGSDETAADSGAAEPDGRSVEKAKDPEGAVINFPRRQNLNTQQPNEVNTRYFPYRTERYSGLRGPYFFDGTAAYDLRDLPDTGGASQKRIDVAEYDLRKPLPKPPPWKKGADIKAHIETYYATEITAGRFHLGVLREDFDLWQEAAKLRRENKLPRGLEILTYNEWNKQQLAKLGGRFTLGDLLRTLRRDGDARTRELIRLYDVARKLAEKEGLPDQPAGRKWGGSHQKAPR